MRGCWLVVLLALANGAVAKGGKELFTNGDFEKGVEGWRFLNQSGTSSVHPDKKTKAEGKQSLRIERRGTGNIDWLKQFVSLPASEGKVKVTVRYKVSKKGRVEIEFGFTGADGEFVGKGMMPLAQSGKTKRFEKEEKTFKIPKKATGCGMNVRIVRPGEVWLDGFSVVLVGGGEFNGKFDKSVVGWAPLVPSTPSTQARHDRKTKASGKGSLCLERSSHRLLPEEGVMAEIEDLGKAKSVTLKFACRVEAPARGTAALLALGRDGILLDAARLVAAEPGRSFRNHDLKLKLPKGTESVRVCLALQGRGRVWFDNVKLEMR